MFNHLKVLQIMSEVKATPSTSRKMDKMSGTNSKGKRLSKEQAMIAVFSNDMLMEEILARAIRSNRGLSQNSGLTSNKNAPRHALSEVMNLRLVCKAWNFTISKLHRKTNQSLFHLPLNHENTSGLLAVDNGTCKEEREEKTLLNTFVEEMQNWGYTSDQAEYGDKCRNIPPFHLSLTPTFFKVANAPVYQNLFSFLVEHAPESLSRFTFNFHRNRFDYIPTTFPDFSFRRLTHVHLIIERMAWSFIPLIQKFLECSPNLHTLDLTSSSCIVTHSVPHLTDTIDSIAKSRPYSLRLPESTRKILLYGTPDTCSCFYRIPVDNLIQLETLALSASSCILRQIDDIFQYVAQRILHLHFIGFTSCVYLFNQSYLISIIPMPRLETLTITMPWEIRPGMWFQYSSHLPSLKELTVIHYEGDHVFYRFLGNGRVSTTLERCTMLAVKPHVHADNGIRSTSQRIEVTKLAVVKSINDCFPNLTHLGIGVNTDYIKALEFVFSEMTTLRSLAIYVESNVKFKTTICWDALFTGLSEIACEVMRENDIPGYWDTICLLDDKFPSIRDLRNLEALYLVETSYPSCRAFSFGENGSGGSGHGLCNFEADSLPATKDHFFTELSFYFSFLRMKNLKTLACTKGFLPCEQVQSRWIREKGTKIKTIRSPKPYHLLTAKFSLFDNTWYSH